MRILLATLLALSAIPAVVHPSTIMVYVEELGDEGLTPEPHAVRGGLLSGLFDQGHIIFDPGEATVSDVSWETGRSRQLPVMALQGGASLLVTVRSEMRATARDEGRPTIDVTLSYHLFDLTGAAPVSIASGTLTATNRGKEDDSPAEAVANEAGNRCALAVHAALGDTRRFR